MTSKERFLAAVRGEQPDRVPVCPDISNMIPCRLTGKPFWDVYIFQNPPLWKAYIEAAEYFGFDAWSDWAPDLEFKGIPRVSFQFGRVSRESVVAGATIGTPFGIIGQEMTYRAADPPATTGPALKNLVEDIRKIRWLLRRIKRVKFDNAVERRGLLGDRGVVGVSISIPGFQGWIDFATLENLSYWYFDRPDLIEELRRVHHAAALKVAEQIIDFRPDIIDIAASGGITLQSPKIFRELALPTLKVITRWAREAGVPTMMHSCGRARDLVSICAEETDLNCLNPLERPPLGDCDLREIKRAYGSRLALMGNLPTTTLMLFGAPDEVESECIAAIDDAAAGGGFILSTGDQCGRDTPEENIFRMIDTAHRYGKY